MELLRAFAILGAGFGVGTFLIMWNFRGRGFKELAFWRKSEEASQVPGRSESR